MKRAAAIVVLVALLLAAAYGLQRRDAGQGGGAGAATVAPPPPRGTPAAAESVHRALLADPTLDDHPGRAARLRYNLGTSLLLQRRYDEARPHLQEAEGAIGARDPEPAYNLGNADLEPAFHDSGAEGRAERLHRAIDAYRRALLTDPADLDAKWNLELARRLLDEVEPPPAGGGGGGDGGGDGPAREGDAAPSPAPASGSGPQPRMSPAEADELLRSAEEIEQRVQRERLRRPQPPGPLLP